MRRGLPFPSQVHSENLAGGFSAVLAPARVGAERTRSAQQQHLRICEIERHGVTAGKQQVVEVLDAPVVVRVPIGEGDRLVLLMAVAVAAAAKTRGGLALAVLQRKHQLGVERRGHQPGKPAPRIAQAVGAEKAAQHQRRIHK